MGQLVHVPQVVGSSPLVRTASSRGTRSPLRAAKLRKPNGSSSCHRCETAHAKNQTLLSHRRQRQPSEPLCGSTRSPFLVCLGPEAPASQACVIRTDDLRLLQRDQHCGLLGTYGNPGPTWPSRRRSPARLNCRRSSQNLEHESGLEPATSTLATWAKSLKSLRIPARKPQEAAQSRSCVPDWARSRHGAHRC